MNISIQKSLALRLFAYLRQAERSIDHALDGAREWTLLREFYGCERLRALRELLAELQEKVGDAHSARSPHDFGKTDLVWMMIFPVIALLNRAKSQWRFRCDDMAFICATFRSLIEALSSNSQPESAQLVQLRMDLHACQWIIERRMHGVPELQKASRIEHFYEPDFMRHVTMEELGICAKETTSRVETLKLGE